MELKQGYKQTEVGMIPVDWDLIKIGECLEFKNGLNKEKEYFGQGTPIVNYMDVYKYAGIRAKDLTGLVTLSNAEIKNYEVKKGDVFFTRTSETVDEIGVSTVVLDEMVDTVFSGFVLRGRPKNDKIYLEFKKYCFTAAIVRKQIISTASYTTRALTNGHLLSNVSLPLPTKAEQTAIATALSDIDELISQTEKLIDKKKAIKQGVMQELLKPKKGWVTKKLGDVIDKVTTGKLDANAMKQDGDYRFYTCAREYYFIDYFAFDDEALLISGNGVNVGYIHYYKGKFNAYQRTYVLTGFKVNVWYVKIFLDKYLSERIATEVSAGSTPYIKMDTITDMKIQFPTSDSEQYSISNSINDIAAEIILIEIKLNKLKHQKQGMMQALLTGKIRLV
jgi:type I restriction enzyme S subunit